MRRDLHALELRVERLEAMLASAREAPSMDRAPPGSLRRLVECAARECDVTVTALLGNRRMQPTAAVRQLCYWLACQDEARSLTQIARFFGGRDHTTVMFGARAHYARMACPEVAARTARIQAAWRAADAGCAGAREARDAEGPRGADPHPTTTGETP